MMGCVPGDEYVAAQVALPAVTVTVPQPAIVVPLSVKATVPVGAPLPGGATPIDAVYVTCSPTTAPFDDEPRVVSVEAWDTVSTTAGDVLVPYEPLPLYVAVKLCEPTVAGAAVHVATPLPFSVLAAHPVTVVGPSLNATVPAGVPSSAAVPLTLAVSVSASPTTLEAGV
jgi:hypothetical protein